MVLVVGCNTPPPVGHPLSEGDGPAHTTSPRPSPGGEGVDSPALTGTPSQRGTACRTLVGIDSLMWVQPDSALAVMLEFAGSEAADGMDAFEGHYCQVLVAELLFKNYYAQSNRTEVLKAVGYFDSIVDLHGAAVRERDAFLAARAHYINGAGFYEHDSLIEACGEYLCALRMMESHFAEGEMVGKKAQFMALTYNRLLDLFSEQYMQEPAIYCGKQGLIYTRIAPTSPYGASNVFYRIGKQYDKLKAVDSTVYYYDKALELLPDRNNMIYRDIVSSRALFDYEWHHDTFGALDSLKRIATQAANETERLVRFLAIGNIYQDIGQYDSAKVYLEPVFEKDSSRAALAARVLHGIALKEGDTIKSNVYAQFLIEDAFVNAEIQAQVSQLNDMFQQHLQWEQEKAEAERRQAEQLAARQRMVRGVVTAVVVLLVLGVGLWWWMAKRKKEHEAEAQILNEEKQQLQTQVDDALQQLQTQADDALQQARAMLPQRVADLYRAKVPNRLERIMDEFEAAYPGAMERVAAAYPNLTKTETQLFVLSFLQFRAKEEADLLGLSQNTVLQYRSNLRKKTGNASISSFLEA